jgi:hypothetical protein
MGWLTPKYPKADTADASALPQKVSRREQRQAAAAENNQRQRAGDLRTIAAAVRNGGDTDLQAARKLIRRMMPDATDAEIRQAHAAARR